MGTNDGGVVYDYGRCPCTGNYEGRFIEVEMDVAGRQIVVTSIPQGECLGCGSQVYKLQIIERMETLMRPERT